MVRRSARHRRFGSVGPTAVLIAIGVAAATAVGVTIAVRSPDRGDDNESADPEVGRPSPFTVPSDGDVTQVEAERISVSASSHIPPDGPITYEPANTIDGDRATAWNSDAPDTLGRGERLTYRFTQPVDLKVVRFVNGYVKNDTVYNANHRVRELVIETDGSSQAVSLIDTGTEQEITFDFGLTSKVTIEVVDIYQGDGFEREDLSPDLAITEVGFLAIQP